MPIIGEGAYVKELPIEGLGPPYAVLVGLATPTPIISLISLRLV